MPNQRIPSNLTLSPRSQWSRGPVVVSSSAIFYLPSPIFSVFALVCGCPTPSAKLAGMKLKMLDWLTRNKGETLAYFGDARLVKQLSGKIELIGGTLDDQRAAREWCSLFLHEAAFACAARLSPCARREFCSTCTHRGQSPHGQCADLNC